MVPPASRTTDPSKMKTPNESRLKPYTPPFRRIVPVPIAQPGNISNICRNYPMNHSRPSRMNVCFDTELAFVN